MSFYFYENLYIIGKPPSIDKPYGPYPILVKSGNHTTAIVQAFQYGKYLGHLKCIFNEDGDLIRWNGNPILLDESIQKDSRLKEVVDELKSNVDRLANVILYILFTFQSLSKILKMYAFILAMKVN